MEVFDVVKIGSKNTVALVNCGLNVTEGGIRPTFHSAALKRSLFLTLHLAKSDLVEQVSQPGTHVFFPPDTKCFDQKAACCTQEDCLHSSCRAKRNYAAGYGSAMFFPPPPNTHDDMFSKRALDYCEAALDNSDFLSIKPKGGGVL